MPMTDIFVPEGALARPAAAPLTRGRREPNAGILGPDAAREAPSGMVRAR
ncbi:MULTISPECIES: hypothetical protein [Burkholderia]|nr:MULTISPECIES: hypothetical protein [Burkholderia]EDS87508.1 hypothetical protein BURPSS13_P1057 [Burkholderia pseudomallei S13]EEC35479.1 hypothetical protein BUC_1633 [Burkholderia pseudomallei 576]KGS83268.1 hypothetical protein X942_2776 [Burkholderia pseudomallei MSHR5596]MBF3727805.1 hypothetical protein [Burkholderia pseudomallei]MBF3780475.1 hypothetical protein [Burkholderia pseudomallei]